MTKRSGIKDMIWAVCIGLALLALFVGFVLTAVGRWYGDKSRPVMNIGAKTVVEGGAAEVGSGTGTVADGKLHQLKKTADAGQDYLDSLTFLVDSSLIGLRDSGLTQGQVWSSDSGELDMSLAYGWNIVYPGDGSVISPANAAMILKPGILVIAVGSDGVGELGEEDFVENYGMLIDSILAASPETRVVLGSVCSVTTAYAGFDGWNADRAALVNSWIQKVCENTGALYADWSGSLTDGGYLRPEYATASGRALSNAGLGTLLGWLRTHAATR